MKYSKPIIVGMVCLIIGALLGTGIAYFFIPAKIKVVKKTEIRWKDRIVYRDYPSMTTPELVEQLQCYDLSKPYLDGEVKKNVFHARAGLCEREWERDFVLASHATGNWKVTLGVSVGALAVGAVSGILLYDHLRK